MKPKRIPCSECRCGVDGLRCKKCSPTRGCVLPRKRILSSCKECKYGYESANLDAYCCRSCCRTRIGNEVRCIHCDQCEAGIEHKGGSKGYCNAAGCQCGWRHNTVADVYECKLCCPCGICKYGDEDICCICGCECGNRKHNVAQPAQATDFTGFICCPCARCFPSVAKVYLENGESVTMAELQIGDRVQAGE